MKRKLNLPAIQHEFRQSKNQYLVAAAVICLGILIGGISAFILSEANVSALSGYMNNFFSAFSLQTLSKNEVFRLSLLGNLKTILLLWICSFSVFLLPVSLLHIGARGFRIGFSIAFMLKQYLFKGALFSAVSILPHNLILVPALLVYTVFCMNFAVEMKRLRANNTLYRVKKQMYLKNLKTLLLIVAVILVASLLEGYIVPALLRPLCSLFVS